MHNIFFTYVYSLYIKPERPFILNVSLIGFLCKFYVKGSLINYVTLKFHLRFLYNAKVIFYL